MTTINIPDGLPILSKGSHDDPSEGACFMEYTALLAGERFSDQPGCVDQGLAIFMQGVNDILLDDDRSMLVPFLGRGIGLSIPELRFGEFQQLEKLGEITQTWRQYADGYQQLVVDLRKRVVDKLAKRLRLRKTVDVTTPCAHGKSVKQRMPYDYADGENFGAQLFDALNARVWSEWTDASKRYVLRLEFIERWVEAVHVAYEEALAEMGYTKSAEPKVCGLPSLEELISTS